MRKSLVVAVALAFSSACAGYQEDSAGGEVAIDPTEAAKTVALDVRSRYSTGAALFTVESGHRQFLGSVGANDSTVILLDPTLFPTGFLYISVSPSDGRRTFVGPISASKGDRIILRIPPDVSMARATTVRP
jgi:hypothetical protein